MQPRAFHLLRRATLCTLTGLATSVTVAWSGVWLMDPASTRARAMLAALESPDRSASATVTRITHPMVTLTHTKVDSNSPFPGAHRVLEPRLAPQSPHPPPPTDPMELPKWARQALGPWTHGQRPWPTNRIKTGAEYGSPSRFRYTLASGWPCRAFDCEYVLEVSPRRFVVVGGVALSNTGSIDDVIAFVTGAVVPKALPYHPIPLGLAIDSALYGSGIFVASHSLRLAQRFFRRRRRACEACGYPLAGLPGPCPECGLQPRPTSPATSPPS